MWELLEKQKRWSEISRLNVLKTLTNLEQTLTARADLVDYAEKNLYTMSVEFCLLLSKEKTFISRRWVGDKTVINLSYFSNTRSRFIYGSDTGQIFESLGNE